MSLPPDSEKSNAEVSTTQKISKAARTKKTKHKTAKVAGSSVPYHEQIYFSYDNKPFIKDVEAKSNYAPKTSSQSKLDNSMPSQPSRKTSFDSVTTLASVNNNSFASRIDNTSVFVSLGYSLNSRTVNDTEAIDVVKRLIKDYGLMCHMAVLDPNYTFFINKAQNGALHYKLKDKVTVVAGNPLCDPQQWPSLLLEFEQFRKKKNLGIVFLGISGKFATYAKAQQKWVSMRFGTERALNPTTNPVLLEREGKRMLKQNKQLLDPQRGNLNLHVYIPANKQDRQLEAQLMNIYETWRRTKNQNRTAQAYVTVFEPFSLPHLMTYIYTTDSNRNPNGFAALRRIDAAHGYHMDPYCALPDAPRGVSDLLIYASLALLNRAGVQYLGLGFEPSEEMSDIQGLNPLMVNLLKSSYRRTQSILPLSGKKAFHDKWHPDPHFDEGLYNVYPNGRPDLRHLLATMHFANASVRQVTKKGLKDCFGKNKIEDRHADTRSSTSYSSSTVSSNRTSISADSINGIARSDITRSTSSLHHAIFSASKGSLHFGISVKEIFDHI